MAGQRVERLEVEGVNRPHGRLCIVICTHNRRASLIKTLESIYDCGYEGEGRLRIDILVVANNCTDDTIAALEGFASERTSEHLFLDWVEEARPGKSYALNTAIAHTSHECLSFVDDDQFVENGFLGYLLEGLSAYRDDSIYCGRIWPAWDGSEPSWVHVEGAYKIPIRPFPEYDLGDKSFTLAAADRLPSGGNLTVKREVFDEVGCFAIELGPTGHNLAGGEDHEFLKRARDAGLSIRYLPKVRQLHAIDLCRTKKTYLLRKSFLRSRSNILLGREAQSIKMYHFSRVVSYMARIATSRGADRRFYYMVRLSAALGELSGALSSGREKMEW